MITEFENERVRISRMWYEQDNDKMVTLTSLQEIADRNADSFDDDDEPVGIWDCD